MKKITLVIFGSFIAITPLAAQTRFVPLGYLDGSGPTSEAYAVTPNGAKIVGYSTASGTQNVACLWSSSNMWQTGTIAGLPAAATFYNNSAQATSADGSVIVGVTGSGGSTSAEQAFYYTPATQIQLVPFPASQHSSAAAAVTGDGAVVVGVAASFNTLQSKAFRWDRSQAAAVFLPPYPQSTVPNAAAYGVSDDGRRVVGVVQTSSNTYAAARWDDGVAPVLFSNAGDPVIAVQAQSTTPDGSVVVGAAYIASTGQGVGFRWTAAGGVVALPIPTTGGTYAIEGATAMKVSGDGRVIVGYGHNVHGEDEAIVWIDLQPYRVAAIANASGVLPPSWETYRAYGTDYYGNVICGMGRATSGKLEAYALVRDASHGPPPAPTPTVTPTPSPSATPTATATASATPRSTPTASATPRSTPTATATSTPHLTPTPTATATTTPHSTATPTATATKSHPHAINIATRLNVLSADKALFGGFIITGSQAKKVLLRGTGPSLTAFGVANALQDPTLELHDGSGATIATNDNWRTTQVGGIITSNQAAAIQQSGAAPSDDREPAILATLAPGNYSAIVRGKNNSTGIGVVEAYDLDQTANSKLANIASRGFLDTGDDAVIAGFIIAQGESAKLIVRAIGPSLSNVGVTGALQDPTLDLRDGNGTRIVFNNDWQETQKQEIIDTGIPPSDTRESAIVRTLTPGNYTAIVRGNLNTTGIAVVEVYDLTP